MKSLNQKLLFDKAGVCEVLSIADSEFDILLTDKHLNPPLLIGQTEVWTYDMIEMSVQRLEGANPKEGNSWTK